MPTNRAESSLQPAIDHYQVKLNNLTDRISQAYSLTDLLLDDRQEFANSDFNLNLYGTPRSNPRVLELVEQNNGSITRISGQLTPRFLRSPSLQPSFLRADNQNTTTFFSSQELYQITPLTNTGFMIFRHRPGQTEFKIELDSRNGSTEVIYQPHQDDPDYFTVAELLDPRIYNHLGIQLPQHLPRQTVIDRLTKSQAAIGLIDQQQ